MKISTLVKREDFYKILRRTLVDYLETDEDEISTYYVYQKLNIVCTDAIDDNLFRFLTSEYKYSQNTVKSILQRLYILIISHKVTRFLKLIQTIKLPQTYRNDAIIGGNHRIRIFKKGANCNLVLLKAGEFNKFVEKDIKLRSSLILSYAPKLINYSDFWYEEENIVGIPGNRTPSDCQESLLDRLYCRHYEEVILPNLEWSSGEYFIRLVKNSLEELKELNNIRLARVIDEFINILEKSLSSITVSIPTSTTHGDCQLGNVRIHDENVYLLDWEAVDLRYAYYDEFVLYGSIRVHKDFYRAYKLHAEKTAQKNNAKIKQSKLDLILLLVEEIRFNIFEECSYNYVDISDYTYSLLEAFKYEVENGYN